MFTSYILAAGSVGHVDRARMAARSGRTAGREPRTEVAEARQTPAGRSHCFVVLREWRELDTDHCRCRRAGHQRQQQERRQATAGGGCQRGQNGRWCHARRDADALRRLHPPDPPAATLLHRKALAERSL